MRRNANTHLVTLGYIFLTLLILLHWLSNRVKQRHNALHWIPTQRNIMGTCVVLYNCVCTVYVSQCIVLYVGLYPVTPNVVPYICVIMHCVIRCVAQCTLQTVTPNGNMCSSEWAFQLQAWVRSSCSRGSDPTSGGASHRHKQPQWKYTWKLKRAFHLLRTRSCIIVCSRCSEFGWVALQCWAGTSNVF